jgi:hypothetical protein
MIATMIPTQLAVKEGQKMNVSAYEIALIAGGFTITGILLGAWLGYRFSLSLANVNERRRAAMKLREAFKDELLALNPAKHAVKIDLVAFLENAFSKHRAAVLDFAYFLAPKEKRAFYMAWYEYHCHPDARNEETVPFFEQYSCLGLTIKQEHERKNLAQSRIERILEFAKPK